MAAPHDLDRFVAAQRDTYQRALDEIRAGRKRSHWMWFIFPQIAGLGHSPMAQRYAIVDLAEAQAYLAHPVLGDRLREVTRALPARADAAAETIFGAIDAMKLRSSLTLFAHADAKRDGLFRRALERWFGGVDDPATLARL